MINMIQNAKTQAASLAMAAYESAVADGTLPRAAVPAAPVEIPKDTANGDFTTTFAMAAARALRQPPLKLKPAVGAQRGSHRKHKPQCGTAFTAAQRLSLPDAANRLHKKIFTVIVDVRPQRAQTIRGCFDILGQSCTLYLCRPIRQGGTDEQPVCL